MKKIFVYALPALAMGITSCADGYEGNFKMDKPESVEHAEQLAALPTLKSAVDRAANPNFKLGLAVSSADYVSRGLTYSIALTNFDMVSDLGALAYGTIMNEESAMVLTPMTDMFLADSPAVAGGAMLAYNALPKSHLEGVISPTFVKGDLAVGSFTVADFDDQQLGKEYPMSNGSVAVVAANPTGADGNVLQIGTNDDKARNSYAELTLDLPDGLTVGNLTGVIFDLYCPDDKSQKRNFVAILNGMRKNFTGDTPEKRGCPLETWMNKIPLDISDIELSDDVSKSTKLTLSIGPNVNNSYYFIDNVQLTWSTGVPDKYVDKTDAEKAAALADNFSAWADVVMEACAPSVSDYVVLANPMADVTPYALRSAATEVEAGNDISGAFFFNDYMGDNYVKTVTDCLSNSYKTFDGQGTPIFFISESGLVGNPDKTGSLVSQIAAWTAAGAKIDGIAVNMNGIDTSASGRQAVTELFQSLDGSGKLIRLDNLTVNDTEAEFYGFVVAEYFRIIKAENRAGIIFGATTGLWKNNVRTDAYEAIINAMSQK